SGLNEVQENAAFLRPRLGVLAAKLGPVVDGELFGFAVNPDEAVENPRDALARNAECHFDAQTLACAIVNNVQCAEAQPRLKAIRHKVHRPPNIRPRRHSHRRNSPSYRQPLARPPANLKVLLRVNAINAFVIDYVALLAQFGVDAAVAKTPSLKSDDF